MVLAGTGGSHPFSLQENVSEATQDISMYIYDFIDVFIFCLILIES